MTKGFLNDDFDVPGSLTASDATLSSNTAYAVVCGGTTSNNPLQSIAGVGTSSQVLTSNGAGALPTFQDQAGGTPELVEGLVQNLSIGVSGTTLTIASGDGTALSASNIGYVTVPSGVTPGELVLHSFTANVAMTNTEMDGNLFGTTVSVAWGDSKPFYLYVMQDDSDANPVFALGAIPHIKVAPVSTEIGDPSSAVADEQYSMYSIDDITETSYDTNPVQLIGSFTATKSSSDVWTFDALVEGTQGIGLFQEPTYFAFPLGQNGAQAGTHQIATAGTEPQWAEEAYAYRIGLDGICHTVMQYEDCTTPGVGTQDITFVLPLARTTFTGINCNFGGVINYGIQGTGQSNLLPYSQSSTTAFQMYDENGIITSASQDRVENEDVDSGDDLWIELNYPIKSA